MIRIPVVEVADLEHRCQLRDFEILKVNFKLDVKKLLTVCTEIKQTYPFQIKDRDPLYRGISLQYTDEKNPIYDGIQESFNEIPKIFHKRNEVAERLSYFFSSLPFQTYRTRILDSYPGHRLIKHSDGPVRITFHLPLSSSPQSLFYINDNPYHLECDGSVYLANTSYPHWIENKSSEIRTHIIGNLSQMSFWPLTSTYLEQLNEYYQKIGSEGVKKIMSRFVIENLVPRENCEKCHLKKKLFPIVYDFKEEAKFYLLCKSCTSLALAAF